jgi:hypothetical protein
MIGSSFLIKARFVFFCLKSLDFIDPFFISDFRIRYTVESYTKRGWYFQEYVFEEWFIYRTGGNSQSQSLK